MKKSNPKENTRELFYIDHPSTYADDTYK